MLETLAAGHLVSSGVAALTVPAFAARSRFSQCGPSS